MCCRLIALSIITKTCIFIKSPLCDATLVEVTKNELHRSVQSGNFPKTGDPGTFLTVSKTLPPEIANEYTYKISQYHNNSQLKSGQFVFVTARAKLRNSYGLIEIQQTTPFNVLDGMNTQYTFIEDSSRKLIAIRIKDAIESNFENGVEVGQVDQNSRVVLKNGVDFLISTGGSANGDVAWHTVLVGKEFPE